MMNESLETVDLKPNHETNTVAVEENGKRPLDQSEDACESQPKICKLDNESDNNQSNTLSKRQLKKIQKQQMWMEKKAKRRETNKERKVEMKKRKAQMRESGIEIPIVRTKKMAESTCKQRIVLDMSYDDLMSDKINYLENSFDKEFQKEEIVYLTSDSLNVLESIDENKVYIIGGLVDHNSCKGASLKVANDLGIAHARLPIDENINMQTRKILTINHVFEIISKVVSGMSWKEALISTLPKRKMFSAIDEGDLLEYENCSQEYKPKEEIECSEAEKNENVSVKNVIEQNVSVEN
ncbi:RNA (guanine-9-)-methyltransferase domain-containing protein 2 homolog isoform X1 [Acyrthosiphon pisum]|uniref:tRNA (guanine(9)-N(1))-methyltransferase n=1 Tax=Acyrthosiphon pisum TaxID=7029 RepID=A0A8R2HAW3_ACYPI|nr:RNA (guanine-9-)-methyltransferase domain-containing protein 2 homolog isoform X1 [Acyrthosiphon pisum]|eukprot:XP_016663408.1 PREDICTED: RNA (guanine-9-)-methyltransferase domain-containing protein 2 homolog isoform X1 [Acyrthosiphon pisum]